MRREEWRQGSNGRTRFSWTRYTEHRGREGANCGASVVVNDGNAIDGRVIVRKRKRSEGEAFCGGS